MLLYILPSGLLDDYHAAEILDSGTLKPLHSEVLLHVLPSGLLDLLYSGRCTMLALILQETLEEELDLFGRKGEVCGPLKKAAYPFSNALLYFLHTKQCQC